MRVGSWVRIATSAAVVGFIVWRVPLLFLAAAFRRLDVRWLWPALACVLGMLAVRWYRWHRLLKAGNVHVPRRDSVRSLLGGFTLSVITPGRVGEFGRCLFIANSHRSGALLLNILDRAFDMLALLTCAMVSLFAIAPRPYGVVGLGVWLALLPVALGFPSLVASLGRLPWWSRSFREKLHTAAHSVERIQTAPFAAWALLSTSLDLLTFFFLLRSFQPVDFNAALVTFPWIVMAGGLPVSVSGLGPREAVAALLLARYAVSSAVAFDAALLLFIFSALLPALIGGVGLLVQRPPRSSPGLTEDFETLVAGAYPCRPRAAISTVPRAVPARSGERPRGHERIP